jgi:hypothetical protein
MTKVIWHRGSARLGLAWVESGFFIVCHLCVYIHNSRPQDGCLCPLEATYWKFKPRHCHYCLLKSNLLEHLY